LEFLAFSRLSSEDAALFDRFCERVETVGVTKDDTELLETAVRLRREHAVKPPDAVIAATALVKRADLVTADTGFDRVAGLAVVHPTRA
jgi:predicted nucleic acid-binding protein